MDSIPANLITNDLNQSRLYKTMISLVFRICTETLHPEMQVRTWYLQQCVITQYTTNYSIALSAKLIVKNRQLLDALGWENCELLFGSSLVCCSIVYFDHTDHCPKFATGIFQYSLDQGTSMIRKTLGFLHFTSARSSFWFEHVRFLPADRYTLHSTKNWH